MSIELTQRFMNIARKHSPLCYVSADNELIVEPKNNIYFRLADIKTDMDFRCKVLAWLSRPSCHGTNKTWQKKIRTIVNQFLETDFSEDDMEEIYCWLGNDINRPLTIKFIESNYDMLLLSRHAYMKKHSKLV